MSEPGPDSGEGLADEGEREQEGGQVGELRRVDLVLLAHQHDDRRRDAPRASAHIRPITK